MTSDSGFSVIELMLVVAIIGVLSIIVIPKYINLKSNSQTNTTKYLAATLTTANSENYAARIISNANGVAIKNCRDAANMLRNGLPVGYSINSRGAGVNTTVTCTLTGPSSTTASFSVTGIR